MNRIEIAYKDAEDVPEEENIVYFAEKVLKWLGKDNWEISFVFSSDSFIKDLNSKYRSRNEATDVLSFCQEDLDVSNETFYAGDIVISIDAVKRNANNYNVDFEEELKRVIIHGILHLAGMDHNTNNDSEPMLIEQEKILLSIKGDITF